MGVFTKKKLKLQGLNTTPLWGKANFSVIHPIQITIYNF